MRHSWFSSTLANVCMGAGRIINCPRQVLLPQGHSGMVHGKATEMQQNKSLGAGESRALCPGEAELCAHL